MTHQTWRPRRVCLALAAPLLLAGGLTAAGPAASAASCQNWTGVPPPSPGTAGNVLDGVAMVSACDAWAVGFSDGAAQTLAEHWNGSSWAVVPSPNPGSTFNTLTSVRAVSATDIWAVGSFNSRYPAPAPAAASATCALCAPCPLKTPGRSVITPTAPGTRP